MTRLRKLFWERWNRAEDPRHPERPTVGEWLMDSAILLSLPTLLVILLRAGVELIVEFLP